MKAHPHYAAAKSGNVEAAVRLVADLVVRQNLAEASKWFGRDVVWVPVHAEEASGRNSIPVTLAEYYAFNIGGNVTTEIIQTNRAFHTGARPMERLIARTKFDGAVEAGRMHVLVDDVTMLGGTLADLADYVQKGGGRIAGLATLVNAGRADVGSFRGNAVREIEARYGDVVRKEFKAEPVALTPGEQTYILNFRDADALRAGIAKARLERAERLRAKGILLDPGEIEE